MWHHVFCVAPRKLSHIKQQEKRCKKTGESCCVQLVSLSRYARGDGVGRRLDSAGSSLSDIVGQRRANGNHGYEADTGGSTVVVCPLLRKNGTDNLGNVWVRYQRTGGNSSSFINCTVLASNSVGGSTDTVWTQPSAGSSAASLFLPTPDNVVSGGYASVMCVVGPGDTIHGVRYQQS